MTFLSENQYELVFPVLFIKNLFLTRCCLCIFYVEPTGIAKNQNSNLKDASDRLFLHVSYGACGNKILGGLTLAGCQVPIKATLSFPLFNQRVKKKYNERLMGPDKNRERPLTSYHYGQNGFDLGKSI